jgi:hypothetical protein
MTPTDFTFLNLVSMYHQVMGLKILTRANYDITSENKLIFNNPLF